MRIGLLVLLLATALSAALDAQTAITGAQLRGLSIDANRETWECELTNTGSRTITGYVIAMYVRHPDGKRYKRGANSADLLMTGPPPSEKRRLREMGIVAFPIEPGEFVPLKQMRFRSMSPDGQPQPFDVELEAVVYEGGAVEGDAKGAEEILGPRRISLKTYERYVPRIAALKDAENPLDGLKLIYREVTDELYEMDKDPARQQNRESHLARMPLMNLQGELRMMVQIAGRQQSFEQQLQRLEERLARLRTGVQ